MSQPNMSMYRRLSKVFVAALLLGIGYLVIGRLIAIEWQTVLQHVVNFDRYRLLTALLFVSLSYAACTSYDLISRQVLKLSLPAPRVAAKAFVGYAFSLNLGAMLGGMGVRYRLYRRSGVATANIVRLMLLGSISNWVGYSVLAGVLLWQLPDAVLLSINVPRWSMQLIAVGLMSVALAYLLLCALRGGRVLQIRNASVVVPHVYWAILQMALSLLSWCSITSAMFVLMPVGVSWYHTAQTVVVGAVAGAVSHVPGGIGVLEYVFVELLEGKATAASILAGVVVFRALYYILPFMLALIIYVSLELRLKNVLHPRTEPSSTD